MNPISKPMFSVISFYMTDEDLRSLSFFRYSFYDGKAYLFSVLDDWFSCLTKSYT